MLGQILSMQVMIQPFPTHFLIQRAVSVALVPLLKFPILSALCFSHYSQMVKNPPAMWDIWVQSLGWADPPEKGMATHSSILAWRIPWTEEPGKLQSMGSQRAGHD